MKVRKANKEDLTTAKALWAYCFEPETDPFFTWYFEKLASPETILVGEEKGQVATDLHRRPYEVSLRGANFKTDYIVGVATHPAARGKGFAEELLRASFRLAAKEEKPFVLLMPSAASYYLPMGFGFAVHQWERSATPEELHSLSERASEAKLISNKKEYEDLKTIYDAFTKRRNLYTMRDKDSWETHIQGALLEGYIAVVYNDEKPAGYIFYSIQDGNLVVSEMAYTGEKGRRALYSYLASHRGSVSKITWYEPLDDDSYRYWNDGAEHTYIKNRTFPMMLLRITDPVMAFDGLPCDEDLKGRIAFQLVDRFMPENNGIYTLCAEEGKIKALKEDVFYKLKCHIEDMSGLKLGSDLEPAFCITAGALAELFSGSADLESLLEREKVTWLVEGKKQRRKALKLAKALLPKQKNWINEWF